MDLTRIPIGPAPPEDIYVVVEIPRGGEPVKYEIDKVSGTVFVDRFLHTAMFYPGNYGFVPHTLAEDGDPLDALHPFYMAVRSYLGLSEILREQIAHFFTHYKDLEPRKWVSFKGWIGPEEAVRLVQAAINRAKG